MNRLIGQTIGDVIADLAMLPIEQKRAIAKAVIRSLPDSDRREVINELASLPKLSDSLTSQLPDFPPSFAGWAKNHREFRSVNRRAKLTQILRSADSTVAHLLAYMFAGILVTAAAGTILALIAGFTALIHHIVS